MRELSRLTAFIATVALLGCAPASETDLVGTWQVADGSRELLPEELQEAAGTLTLAADGTFAAFELPVSVMRWDRVPPTNEKPTLLTASGEWQLHRVPGASDTVNLYFKAVSGEFTGDLRYGYLFSVHPIFRGYNLVDHWGDPDAVPGIFYSKTEAAGVRRGGS